MTNQKEKPQFILIDGHGIAYRAYYGMLKRGPTLRTRDGIPTGAVFGFTRILLEIIRKYKPRLLAVSFDMADPTTRHEDYEGYKANRKPPPEDLIQQMPLIHDMVEAFGIPIYQKAGFEADDIIGVLAREAAETGHEVRIVTGDRDLFQLVTNQIHILMPSSSGGALQEFDGDAIYEKYGFRPDQVVDYKALAGDSSDNIPGVGGIGDKTAIKLLQEFDNLENIYDSLDKIPERYRKKLEQDRDLALTSQKLARLHTDVGIPFDPDRCQLDQPNQERLIQTLKQLDFNSILRELPQILNHFQGDTVLDLNKAEGIRDLKPQFQILSKLTDVDKLVKTLKQAVHPFALDTETTDVNSLNTHLVGIAIALPTDGKTEANDARCWYLPVGHQLTTVDPHPQLPLEDTLERLKPVLESPNSPKYGHHIKFDMNVLSRYGIQVQGICDDTLILDYILHPENRHGLKELAMFHLNYPMQPITDLIGSGRKQITMAEVISEKAAAYAAADVAVTQELRMFLLQQLNNSERHPLYQDIETPLVEVLARIEQHGVQLDPSILAELSQEMEQSLSQIAADIHEMAGMEFNINSPNQLQEVLFEKMALSPKGIRKTKSGYSTDIKTLEKLQEIHPIANELLKYRHLSKLKSTYIDALPQLINPRTGRLHTTYNQSGTTTGRLSSSNPNLQNIPIRTPLGREIRRAFTVTQPDYVMVSCDYSQIELRLLAHFSEDPRFVEAFQQDRDIHAQTAMEIFNLPSLESVTSEMRRIAKTTNFGIVYGQTVYGLANTLNIPRKEADRIIQRFKQRYPGVQSYMEQTLKQARETGMVTTLFHRQRKLDDIHHPNQNMREFAERMAINSPLQGSAADLIKLAMVRIDRWIREHKSPTRILIQVHDELVFEMPKQELESTLPLLKEIMENVYPLKVPLKVDTNVGQNWMEAK